MAAEATQLTFELKEDGDLQQLLNEIRDLDGRQIVIEIPVSSSCLTTHEEMSQLQELARRNKTALILRTEDPVRQELARILGLKLEPSSETAGHRLGKIIQQPRPFKKGPHKSDSLHDAITVVGVDAVTVDPPVIDDTHEFSTGVDPEFDLCSQPSFSFVITPPKKHYSDPDPIPAVSIPGRHPLPLRPEKLRNSPSRFTVIAAMALIGITAGIAVVLVGFLAPTATVRLTPITTLIEMELSYGVAGTVNNLDVALEPKTLATTMTWEGSIPTTGERFVPDATATGELALTNPFTSEVTVPGGTVLFSADGSEYLTSYDVTVPAADPFGTQSFGSAVVDLAAVMAGPVGNQEALAITGQLDSGVFFQNQAAITGGTMQRIAVVNQSDLESLQNAAISEFSARTDGEAASLLTGDQVVIENTISLGAVTPVFSAEPGADAETISISASVPLTVRIYSPSELHEIARSGAQDRVANSKLETEELILDSTWVSEPEQVGNAESPSFRLNAGGTLRTIIGQAEIDNLRTDLIGKNQTEAAALVDQINGVTASSIEYGPDWLPILREPRLESRIAIDIVD